MSQKHALIVFAKNPILGTIKTRLAAVLGNQKTLDLYKQLLEIVFQYTNNLPFPKIIYWDGGIPLENPFIGANYYNKSQVSGDLGFKMKSAFRDEFNSYDSLCIIGTDCAELRESIIISAFEFLLRNDIVIGPAVDGGYYLLGMNTLYEKLFEEINWSTETVLQETLDHISSLSLNHHRLEALYDIDNEQDYLAMKKKNLID